MNQEFKRTVCKLKSELDFSVLLKKFGMNKVKIYVTRQRIPLKKNKAADEMLNQEKYILPSFFLNGLLTF